MSIVKKLKLLEMVTILFFIVDRISKMWALSLNDVIPELGHKLSQFNLIPDIYFRLVFNRGMSWGILNSETNIIFALVSILIGIITIGLFRYMIVKYRAGLSVFPESLIFLGSLSNIIDRILYKGVIDFIVVDFGSWIFPIFNLADCAIVFGVFLLCLQMLFAEDMVSETNV